jgi:hypothetical protein
VIVDPDRQHAMFGASGALMVASLASLLAVRRQRPASASLALVSTSSDRVAA